MISSSRIIFFLSENIIFLLSVFLSVLMIYKPYFKYLITLFYIGIIQNVCLFGCLQFILFCEVCTGIEFAMKRYGLSYLWIFSFRIVFEKAIIYPKSFPQAKYCIQNIEVIFLFLFLSLCTFYCLCRQRITIIWENGFRLMRSICVRMRG